MKLVLPFIFILKYIRRLFRENYRALSLEQTEQVKGPNLAKSIRTSKMSLENLHTAPIPVTRCK